MSETPAASASPSPSALYEVHGGVGTERVLPAVWLVPAEDVSIPAGLTDQPLDAHLDWAAHAVDRPADVVEVRREECLMLRVGDDLVPTIWPPGATVLHDAEGLRLEYPDGVVVTAGAPLTGDANRGFEAKSADLSPTLLPQTVAMLDKCGAETDRVMVVTSLGGRALSQ